MKISVFIFLGFVVILVMFSITTYIHFEFAERVTENSEYLVRSSAIIRNSNRFQRNTVNMVSSLRGYFFTEEDLFLQAFDSASSENEQLLVELESYLSEEQSPQITALREIGELSRKWVNEYARPLIQLQKSSDLDKSTLNNVYRERLHHDESIVLNQLNIRIRNFINYEYTARANRSQALGQSIARSRKISILLTSFSIITGLAVAGFLAYRISKRIVKMVSMADTIASGDYTVSVTDSGNDELTQLAISLNRMAAVLAENISLLKRKNNELDQFAHIVSHDMKAPLRGINNLVSWIEEDHGQELSPKVNEYIGLIKNRVIIGENLINGILSYARIGKNELDKELVDVNVLLHDLKNTQSQDKHITILIDDGFPLLFTYKVPLLQVFSNLISNAIKYHDKPNGYVKVYFHEDANAFKFFVEDNGPGIAEIYHRKIFQIFQTLNNNESFENTGVGLAIVKKILDDQNQNITVSSINGKGTVFSFTWPKETVN